MPGIRKAGIKDIELIQELAYSIWRDVYKSILSAGQVNYMLDLIYSKDALSKQMGTLQHQFILVYENNDAVGFASYSAKYPGDQHLYRLHKLYVLTTEQGKGTGKFLLNFIIGEIKQAGAKTLELNVNRHNPAFHFYSKLGFEISREEDIDIGEGYFMNDYVMLKDLTPALS